MSTRDVHQKYICNDMAGSIIRHGLKGNIYGFQKKRWYTGQPNI